MAMSGCIGRIQPPTCRIGRRNLFAPPPPPRTGLQFLRRTPTLPLLRTPPPPFTTTPPSSTAVNNEAEAEASVETEEKSSVLKTKDLFGVLTKNLGLIWWVLITSEPEMLLLEMKLQSLRERNKMLQREYKLLDLIRRLKKLAEREAYSKLVDRLPGCSAWLNDPAGLVADHLPQKIPKLVIVLARVFVALLVLKTMFECFPAIPKLVICGMIALFVLHIAERLASKLIFKDMLIDIMKEEKLMLENYVSELKRRNDMLRVEIYEVKKELAMDTVG